MPDELYDLYEDPLEETNFASLPESAYRHRALEELLTVWFRDHEITGLSGWESAVDGRGQSIPLTRT
ncbi:MAG: hypothetical protein ACTMII_04975 [Brachybacterium sp.]|uniref:hypothetical protein n=1 Tax=unclassified Brachybacterium TaxID=2623841 RepID=UPI003FDFB61D